MAFVRTQDVLSVPGLLSLVRLPLAVAFPFAVHQPVAALLILVASGLSDLLDGWYARRFGQETTTGAILDPVLDKLFVAVVTLTLLISGRLSLHAALLLGARDIVQLPLVFLFIAHPAALANAKHGGSVKANAFGKLVTVLQFATVAAALFRLVLAEPLAIAAGALGIVAGMTYWARSLRKMAKAS